LTLAGTRPPTLDEWNKYELHHRARLAIKPGMATILNQAKETLKTCRKVKKEAENMYVYKNDKRAMKDITTAENVRDAASEAMGKIELEPFGYLIPLYEKRNDWWNGEPNI
jgi:hypothetical protein